MFMDANKIVLKQRIKLAYIMRLQFWSDFLFSPEKYHFRESTSKIFILEIVDEWINPRIYISHPRRHLKPYGM